MTPPERCRYDACLALDPGQTLPPGDGVGEILDVLIQGGEYAVAVHRGRHCDLPQAYAPVCGRGCPRFPRDSGRALHREHTNDTRNTPVEGLRTEIHVPLQAD
jgi:DNA gyrase inhibitor GyrI